MAMLRDLLSSLYDPYSPVCTSVGPSKRCGQALTAWAEFRSNRNWRRIPFQVHPRALATP